MDHKLRYILIHATGVKLKSCYYYYFVLVSLQSCTMDVAHLLCMCIRFDAKNTGKARVLVITMHT